MPVPVKIKKLNKEGNLKYDLHLSAVLEGTNSTLWPIVSLFWYRTTFVAWTLLFSFFFSHFLHGVNTSGERSYRGTPHVYLNATLWKPGLRILNSNAWYPNREARILRLKSCAGFRFGRRHAGLKELRMSVVCYLRLHILWRFLPLLYEAILADTEATDNAQPPVALLPFRLRHFQVGRISCPVIRASWLSIRRPKSTFSSVNLIARECTLSF